MERPQQNEMVYELVLRPATSLISYFYIATGQLEEWKNLRCITVEIITFMDLKLRFLQYLTGSLSTLQRDFLASYLMSEYMKWDISRYIDHFTTFYYENTYEITGELSDSYCPTSVLLLDTEYSRIAKSLRATLAQKMPANRWPTVLQRSRANHIPSEKVLVEHISDVMFLQFIWLQAALR